MTISYVTIGFMRRGRVLVADQPRLSKTADIAVQLAKRLSETRAGAVAFEQSHDAESECYDDPVVLFKSGELPADFSTD
ncbi:MAG: hypothetical protein KL863_19730 [Rhizobium sp.]|nr:hypothetical protein [Rhizobium sp.]